MTSLLGVLGRALGIFAAGALLPWLSQARANSTWKVASGSWDNASNWNGGVPTGTSFAIFNNSGTATLASGVTGTGALVYTGTTAGTAGTVLVSGGRIGVDSTYLGYVAGGAGQAMVTSGTWSNSGLVSVGESGTGTVLVDGGRLSAQTIYLGRNAGSSGTATVTSGTMGGGASSAIYVGSVGTGSLLVNGGLATSQLATVGDASGATGGAVVSSGTWAATGLLNVGNSGKGTLQVSGGYLSSAAASVGYNTASSGTVTVSSGSWANAGVLRVGVYGSGALVGVQTGGAVTSGDVVVGTGTSSNASRGANNTVTIVDQGSVWVISGSLAVGDYGSGNTVSVEDGALLKVGDASGETIVFSLHGGSNNFLRLDGGYAALYGDQTSYVSDTLLANNRIQVWDGAAWTLATAETLEATYFDTDAAALAATGYSGLGGYTVLEAIPEPATLALAGGAGLWLLYRGRARRAG